MLLHIGLVCFWVSCETALPQLGGVSKMPCDGDCAIWETTAEVGSCARQILRVVVDMRKATRGWVGTEGCKHLEPVACFVAEAGRLIVTRAIAKKNGGAAVWKRAMCAYNVVLDGSDRFDTVLRSDRIDAVGQQMGKNYLRADILQWAGKADLPSRRHLAPFLGGVIRYAENPAPCGKNGLPLIGE